MLVLLLRRCRRWSSSKKGNDAKQNPGCDMGGRVLFRFDSAPNIRLLLPRSACHALPPPVIFPSPSNRTRLTPSQSLGADCEPLIEWICDQLQKGRTRGQGVRGAVQALCVLLRNDTARASFARHGGVAYLTKMIRMQVRRGAAPCLFLQALPSLHRS